MNILKQLREEKNVSQAEVAKQIGITTSYYGMIEGCTRKPSLSVAIKLAKYFKKNVEKIFFEN